MRRHGLDVHIRILGGGLTEESGADAARQLLRNKDLHDKDLPSAAIVFNDRCALGVLDTLLRVGISVPGQFSVVGYDDSSLARLTHINLTTVGQDALAMAELAVTRAVARLTAQPISDREIVIPPYLVIPAGHHCPAARTMLTIEVLREERSPAVVRLEL
jgi:DNA-binding LacI/PurR family transcriptional regulator